MKKTAWLIVASLSFGLLLSGCSEVNKNAETVITYIKSEDLQGGKVALEKIRNNKELEKKDKKEIESIVQSELEKKVQSVIANFTKGKTNTKELENQFIKLKAFQISDLNKDIEKQKKEISALLVSREQFQRGETSLAKKDYKKALVYFSGVTKEDTKHKEAQEKIETAKNELLTSFKKEVEKQTSISSLASSLYEVNRYFEGNVDFDLLVDTLNIEANVQSDELEKQKKYKEAIDLLVSINLLTNDSKTSEKISKIQTAQKQELEVIKKNLLSQVTIKYDDIDNLTRIVPKGFPADVAKVDYNSVSIYPILIFAGNELEADPNPTIRYLLGFGQDDWIFMDNIQFNVDSSLFNWSVPFGDSQTQVAMGGIFEWTERVSLVHAELLGDLERIANSKSAKLRFDGSSGFRDYIITDTDKKRIKLFLDIYHLYSSNSSNL